jgi:hypothetical protein
MAAAAFPIGVRAEGGSAALAQLGERIGRAPGADLDAMAAAFRPIDSRARALAADRTRKRSMRGCFSGFGASGEAATPGLREWA